MSERQDGYYWVIWHGDWDDEPQVAEWAHDKWWLVGMCEPVERGVEPLEAILRQDVAQ